MLDLGRDDLAPPPVETGRDRRPVVIAAVVVAVLLAGLLLTSGGGDGANDDDNGSARAAEAAESTTSTTRRTRPSIVRRPTTSTLPPPISTQPIGARLAVVRDGELALVDVDANTWSTVAIPELVAGDGQAGVLTETVARRGDHLVFQAPDATFAVSLSAPGPARRLAESILFLSAVADDEVWVVQPPEGAPASVQRYRTDGTALTEPRPLPVDWTPVGAVEGGLVLRRGSRFQVWDPATRTTALMSEPDVNVLGARGRTVAWHAGCELPICSLHLTDAVTGADRLVFLDDVQIDWGRGSFSPDGRHLLLHAHRVENQSSWRPGLLVVDLGAATARFLELDQPDLAGGPITWSADSRWAFLQANRSGSRTVLAFSPGGEVFVELDLPREARGVAMAAY